MLKQMKPFALSFTNLTRSRAFIMRRSPFHSTNYTHTNAHILPVPIWSTFPQKVVKKERKLVRFGFCWRRDYIGTESPLPPQKNSKSCNYEQQPGDLPWALSRHNVKGFVGHWSNRAMLARLWTSKTQSTQRRFADTPKQK